MQLIKINIGDITVGDELPWQVLDEGGTLLLQAGYVVPNERQLKTIIDHGYRWDETVQEQFVREVHPFEKNKELQVRLSRVLNEMKEESDLSRSAYNILQIVEELTMLCARAPDVMIGAVHLFNDKPYSITHLLHMGILVALLADDIGMEEIKKKSVVGAALTCNVSMLKLQEMLEQQTSPLSDDQRSSVRNHPSDAVKILKKHDIDDPVWLEAVQYHHENVDGTGYPEGRKGGEIPLVARLLAVADNYSALVTKKNYRKGHTPSAVLKHFFNQKGKRLDEELSLRLIKLFGIYPPGTFVKLANGESAIVCFRPTKQGTVAPTVCSYRSATGPFLAQAELRDTSIAKFKIAEVIAFENQPYDYDVIWESQS
ncbi:MAG: HD domain-containing protein [Gammaproteobacteria bacterium]|nr:HD domain-containing protein [Gammaproteobacteria bacterium]